MVNELIALSVALQKAGISPEDWHPQLRPLPNASKQKPCFRIVLNQQGKISEISEISMNLIPKLKKYESSNGDSFPGFNLNPLYRIAIDKTSDSGKEIQKLLKAWRNDKKPAPVDMELLNSWMCDDNNNWDIKQNKKLDRCLDKVAAKMKAVIDTDNTPNLAELLKRTHMVKNDFRSRLSNYIQLLDPLPVELLRFLIHEGDARKDPNKDRGSVSVFLEIEGWEQLTDECPIANEHTIKQLNRALLSEANNNSAKNIRRKDEGQKDAYGKISHGASEKMPNVKLPILGGVKLRAMNSESPCQNRYGSIDALSFQVGEESRKQAKGALEWLAKDSHVGKTWCRSGLKELVFIYPETLPDAPIQMAGIFTPVSNDQPFTEATKEVVNAIKGKLEKEKRDIPINVFALRRMDKARTKVVFDRTYSAQNLIAAATEWKQGCSNIPEISIRYWGKKKGEVKHGGCLTPYPLEIAPCLNRIWKLDGTSVSEGQELQPSDGISMLMNELSPSLLSHILSVAIKNGANLLQYIGGELNQGNVLATKKDIERYKRMIPSIIGLLLFKLNIKKDRYMKQTPFLLGQLLKLSDEIHALYCDVVRNKHYPQQLIGNALLTSASESPKQALSTLCTRLNPYLGWAKTHRFKNRSETKEFTTHKKAGWLLTVYESVADQLAELSIPERFSDADRAQLLIGYLASHPKKEKPQTTQNNS